VIIDIQPLKRKDILEMDQMFLKQGWPSRKQLLIDYLNEQEAGERYVLLAKINNKTAGYLTMIPLAKHGPFKGLYPEIVDFNVFESYQNQGVGSQLLKAAEEKAREIAAVVTLGVGLHNGYGSAQRLYVKQGYIPDGSGVWFNNQNCAMNAPCCNNDDLVLYLSKEL
jgi:GNAT superfamily N-acetyltransferase